MDDLNGLIQHSFAMRFAHRGLRFFGADTAAQIADRFAIGGGGVSFKVTALTDMDSPLGPEKVAEHSPLVANGLTDVSPVPVSFSLTEAGSAEPGLPPIFEWAGGGDPDDESQERPSFVFAEARLRASGPRWVDANDFLVEEGDGPEPNTRRISRRLLEIMAHRRSRLFGLALANRIVTVMLPAGMLATAKVGSEGASPPPPDGPWLVQPFVSFIKDASNQREFRKSYSLTLFLIPMDERGGGQRRMSVDEIDRTVNAGWNLATVPVESRLPRYRLCGALEKYLAGLCASHAVPGGSRSLGSGGPVTVRQATEMLAFGLAMRLAQGPRGRIGATAVREIGDDVITALGSARVSSVVVIRDFADNGAGGCEGAGAPFGHHELMDRLSLETRGQDWCAKRRYRLDRPFIDDGEYVVGLIPINRCVVVSSDRRHQRAWYRSGLMHAGSIAHMTIGAAIAVGTLRSIDRELEKLEAADPRKIAEFGGEIANDLRELYDLDITSESHRHLYQLLRDRLGINSDYEAIQEKLAALHRSTTTAHEIKSQSQLAVLTAAIVVLSVLILMFTVVVAAHG